MPPPASRLEYCRVRMGSRRRSGISSPMAPERAIDGTLTRSSRWSWSCGGLPLPPTLFCGFAALSVIGNVEWWSILNFGDGPAHGLACSKIKWDANSARGFSLLLPNQRSEFLTQPIRGGGRGSGDGGRRRRSARSTDLGQKVLRRHKPYIHIRETFIYPWSLAGTVWL